MQVLPVILLLCHHAHVSYVSPVAIVNRFLTGQVAVITTLFYLHFSTRCRDRYLTGDHTWAQRGDAFLRPHGKYQSW